MAAFFLAAEISMNAETDVPLYHLNLDDIGHRLVPSLMSLFGEKAATWIWWLGTVSVELCVAVVVLTIAFTGRAIRLGIGLSLICFLHCLLWHITILPIPDDLVWKFPFRAGETPKPNDFWFSGHVANSTLLALYASGQKRGWVKVVSWLYVAFIVWLVLAARTHYSIDIISAFFVAVIVYYITRKLDFLNPKRAFDFARRTKNIKALWKRNSKA